MANKTGVVINKGSSIPPFLGPSKPFMRATLLESKKKVGNFVLWNMLVCPFLCVIVFFAFWSASNYEQQTFFEYIGQLLKNETSIFAVGFITMWAIYHTVEVLLLLSIATDNLNYCKIYLATIAPLIWTLTILGFGLFLWSGLNPLDNNSMTKFLIVFGSSTVLVVNFFGYHLKALSEHVYYVKTFSVIDETTALIEVI